MPLFSTPIYRTLYQLDRSACSEIDEKHGSEIPIEHRLQWISDVRDGKHEQLNPKDVDKYLGRGVGHMPW